MSILRPYLNICPNLEWHLSFLATAKWNILADFYIFLLLSILKAVSCFQFLHFKEYKVCHSNLLGWNFRKNKDSFCLLPPMHASCSKILFLPCPKNSFFCFKLCTSPMKKIHRVNVSSKNYVNFLKDANEWVESKKFYLNTYTVFCSI